MATASRSEFAPPAPGRKAAGYLLTLSGIGIGVVDALHPRASGNYQQALAGMVAGSHWAAAHWVALVTALVLALAVWWLTDLGWVGSAAVPRAGARLAVLATFFMAVSFSVEVAMPANPALGSLAASMQAVGWPAFGLGFLLLALGTGGPLWARIVGVIGAAGLGVAGFVTSGLKQTWAGPLFLLGYLLAIWLIVAGVATIQRRTTA